MNIEDLNPKDYMPDLNTVIDAHIQGVHNNLSAGCKSFSPKLIIEVIDPFNDHKREIIVVMVNADFNDHDTKHDIMESLGKKCYDEQKMPVSISMASECWMSKNQDGIRPSEADDRIEAISIAALGIDRSSDMQMMIFKRDREQNIIEGAFVRYSEGKCESPLLESFYRGFWNEFDKREKGARR